MDLMGLQAATSLGVGGGNCHPPSHLAEGLPQQLKQPQRMTWTKTASTVVEPPGRVSVPVG